MRKKKELLERRDALTADLKARLASFETQAEPPTADQMAEYERLEAERNDINAQIERIEKLEAKAKENATQQTSAARVHDRSEDRPWDGFGEFMSAVAQAAIPGGSFDPRLRQPLAASGASESIPSDGGFLVAPEYSNEIFQRAYNNGQVASRCRVIDLTTSDRLVLPYVDESSRVAGSRWGGVRVYRAAEADTATATKPKFGKLEVKAEKLMGLMYATDELISDASAFGQIAMAAMSDEFAFALDQEIVSGTGVGQCLGILNAGATVSQAIEAGPQTTATVVLANIVKMWARMWARSKGNAVWFINQDVTPQLFQLALSVGNNAYPVYMPPGGISGAPYGTIFGRPVVEIEQCSTLGTVGDVILADMSQYALVRKGGVAAAQSMHVRFIYDEMTFRWTYRVNGQPLWKSPLTPAKGTNTQSPFVTLATR